MIRSPERAGNKSVVAVQVVCRPWNASTGKKLVVVLLMGQSWTPPVSVGSLGFATGWSRFQFPGLGWGLVGKTYQVQQSLDAMQADANPGMSRRDVWDLTGRLRVSLTWVDAGDFGETSEGGRKIANRGRGGIETV